SEGGVVVAAQQDRVRAMVAIKKAESAPDEAVGARAAEDGSIEIDNRVVAVVAVGQMRRRATDFHRIIAGAAEHGSAVAEENRIVALVAIDEAGRATADQDPIVPCPADDGRIGPAVEDCIVAFIALNEVCPVTGMNGVVALAAGDG